MTTQPFVLKNRGFTIIELLIVVTIIGILVSLSVVAYNGVQSGARDKAVISDVNGVVGEVTRYGVNNGGVYGSAVAWYSGGSANANIQFSPSSGNVIDVVANAGLYCVRAFNPAATTHNSIASAYTSGTNTDACSILSASVAAGGTGDASLVGWWKLNGDAMDSSGNGNNGSVSVAASTTGQNGQASGAYLFGGNGTSGVITLPASPSLNSAVLSMSAWVRPTATVAGTIIGSSAVNDGPQLRYSTSGNTQLVYLLRQNVTSIGASTITLPASAWSHVTVTYSSTGQFVYYVNGVAAGSGTNLQAFTFSNYLIGRRDTTTATDVFNGSIDDVRIYNRVLTAGEVAALHAAGAQ